MPLAAGPEADDRAATLFEAWLRLAGYGRMKQQLAGGHDDLIGIFAAARRTLAATAPEMAACAETLAQLCELVARLTRREVATVRDMMNHFALVPVVERRMDALLVAVPALACEQGIERRRLTWRATAWRARGRARSGAERPVDRVFQPQCAG